MEENNNNDSQAMEKIKNAAKDEAKKLTKKGVMKILKLILVELTQMENQSMFFLRP